jgi:predicted DNA-binding transcriptional regulator YafY
MRGDQLARQWQLIQRLAKSRGGMLLDDLATELGCVRRTLYRDLNALMYAGFPVVSEKRDQRVYYRFVDNYRLGDVPFTPDELLALAFGEDLLRPLEGTVFHESIQAALAKIKAGLGPELQAYLATLRDTFRVLPGPHKNYAEYRETIRVLNDAVIAHETLRMKYRTGATGHTKVRDFDPYRVFYRGGGLYALGHDHESGELRTFAVDRIREVATSGRKFELPPDFDFDAYIAGAFGVIAEPAVRVRIRFDPRWASYVAERTWHESQVLQTQDDGSLLLSMEVGGTAEIRTWVLSFGSGAEVLEPASLRDVVRGEFEASLKRYRN